MRIKNPDIRPGRVTPTELPSYRGRRAIAAGMLLLASPGLASCGEFLNTDGPLITDSPIAPTVTATQTITEKPAPSSASTRSGSTDTLSVTQPNAGDIHMYQEPVVRDGNYYHDYANNGAGNRGDRLIAGSSVYLMVSCIEYDKKYADDKLTYGLWYQIADGHEHAGEFVPASMGYNGPHHERYDPSIPTCDPNLTLPDPLKK